MKRLQVRPLQVLSAFWRDKWLVICVVFLFGIASVAYALTRKPEFTSEALLAAPEEDGALGGLTGILGQVSALTGLAGLPSIGSTNIEEVTAVLKSRDFSLRFIQRHKILPELFPDLGLSSGTAGEPGERERQGSLGSGGYKFDANIGSRKLTVEDILDRFNLVRTVTVDRRTGFVILRVRARSPEVAQRIAQAMIDDINGELRDRALAEARRAEEFLQGKIATVQFESVRNTAAALLEAQLKREVMAESRPDFALKVLDPPSLPELRSYPRRTRIVMIGGFLGCLAASVLVLVRMRFRRS